METRLRHQGKEPGSLQRDGLASGVRSGNQQHLVRWLEPHIDRDGVLDHRMPRADELEASLCRELRLDRIHSRRRTAPWPEGHRRGSRPPWQSSSPAGRLRNRSVSSRRIRRISSRSSSSSSTMSLLSSTVAAGSRNSVAPLAELPWTMPGHVATMLGPHHQHEAPVALGDDLFLQVLAELLAARVLLQRAAQPLTLLPQPIANALQLGAGAIEDLAVVVDRVAHRGDFRLERCDTAQRSPSGSERSPRRQRSRHASARPSPRSRRASGAAADRAARRAPRAPSTSR